VADEHRLGGGRPPHWLRAWVSGERNVPFVLINRTMRQLGYEIYITK